MGGARTKGSDHKRRTLDRLVLLDASEPLTHSVAAMKNRCRDASFAIIGHLP
jgi:hypothetical protein